MSEFSKLAAAAARNARNAEVARLAAAKERRAKALQMEELIADLRCDSRNPHVFNHFLKVGFAPRAAYALQEAACAV